MCACSYIHMCMHVCACAYAKVCWCICDCVHAETDRGSYRVKPTAGFQMSKGVLLQCHTARLIDDCLHY